jgi:hypothetical protein
MEGGTSKLLKAHENTLYDIPIPADDFVFVNMDGIKLQQKATWIAAGQQRDSHTVPMTMVSQEGITSVGATTQELARVANQASDLWNSGACLLTIGSKPSTVTLDYDFTVDAQADLEFGNNNGVLELQLIILTGGDAIYSTQILKQFADKIENFQNTRFLGTVTFDAPAESRVILYMYLPLYPTETTIIYNGETSLFNASYSYTHTPSLVPAMRPLSLFKAIAAKMGIVEAHSELLDRYKDVVVTCGDAIRGLPNPSIKTSMNDFYKSFNTITCGALAIEKEILKFEEKRVFARYSDPIDLGESKGLKVSIAKDHQFNTIKIGFPEQNYEDVNGRHEFNNTHVYTTPITRTTKELDLVSVYRADAYGVEFTRINFGGKTTTDSKSDNSVFMLHIEDRIVSGPFVPIITI